MLKVLGENLKASRLADNLSQQVAADRSGISLKAIRNLEAGENASTLSLLLRSRFFPIAALCARQIGSCRLRRRRSTMRCSNVISFGKGGVSAPGGRARR